MTASGGFLPMDAAGQWIVESSGPNQGVSTIHSPARVPTGGTAAYLRPHIPEEVSR